jgi:hypothetical protein
MADYYPGTGADDCYIDNVSAFANDSFLMFGSLSGNQHKSYIRFPSINIPQGATVLTATLTLRASNIATTDTCNAIIYANNIDTSIAPTNKTEFDALALTSGIEWAAIPHTAEYDAYSIPSLVSIIQNVINRDGWSSGNSLGIVIADNLSSSNAIRYGCSYEYASYRPKLTITYILDANATDENSISTIDGIKLTEYNETNIINRASEIISGCSIESVITTTQFIVSPIGMGSSTNVGSVMINKEIDIFGMSSISLAESIFLYVDNYYDLNEELPSMTCTGETLTGEIHTGEANIPIFTIEATLIIGTISVGAGTLPIITIVAETSGVCSVASELPMLELSAYAYTANNCVLAEELPMLQAYAIMVRPDETTACYVLNTETGALSKYTNFGFNSFCEFKGHNLAASPDGIYLLEGSDDDGTDIEASFSPGINDFESAQKKRMLNAYVMFKGDGQCYLKVTGDDGVQYEYLLESIGERTRTVKAKIGKGLKGRSFETEICNIGGTDFDIQEMLLSAEFLKRKIG